MGKGTTFLFLSKKDAYCRLAYKYVGQSKYMSIKQKTKIYVQKKSVYFCSWDCPKGKKIAVVERWPLYIAMDRKSYGPNEN